jgi:hypothetical protein
MTNNLSRGGGFVALLLGPLALQIPSFAVGRVRVDEIGKEKLGEVKGVACNDSKKVLEVRRIIQQG